MFKEKRQRLIRRLHNHRFRIMPILLISLLKAEQVKLNQIWKEAFLPGLVIIFNRKNKFQFALTLEMKYGKLIRQLSLINYLLIKTELHLHLERNVWVIVTLNSLLDIVLPPGRRSLKFFKESSYAYRYTYIFTIP